MGRAFKIFQPWFHPIPFGHGMEWDIHGFSRIVPSHCAILPSADEVFGNSKIYPFRDIEFWQEFIKTVDKGSHPDEDDVAVNIEKTFLPR